MVARISCIALFVLGSLAAGCGGSSANREKPGKVVVTDTEIEILDQVSWAGEAELTPTSHPILDAIASTLDGNPSIKLVEVEAHVANADAEKAKEIGERRAKVVVDYLIAKGIAAERLTAKGVALPADGKEHVEFVVAKRG
jgi:flagellar motor protein MotB